MKKNRNAVALGRKGGKAGKGSPRKRLSAIRANKIRWGKKRKRKCR